MEESTGSDCGLEWIMKRKRTLKHHTELAARRTREFSRLAQIYRLDRLPKPSTWISRNLLMNHKAMRPDINRLSELYGEGFLRSKFGLGESGLRRVWQKVETNFTCDFADVFTSDLKLDQIFLMTLQHLRE